jgi:hypothetical protein
MFENITVAGLATVSKLSLHLYMFRVIQVLENEHRWQQGSGYAKLTQQPHNLYMFVEVHDMEICLTRFMTWKFAAGKQTLLLNLTDHKLIQIWVRFMTWKFPENSKLTTFMFCKTERTGNKADNSPQCPVAAKPALLLS